ncbi:FAD/NAD(P)-binding protein [Candidatus Enterococcus ikei]|uniref:FAD/NAD(P)-binding protein n=1 Tax=Candidatus Enterococcus ikei TaxID=2815326 RepID=A0ABS3H003_9ENTE|nr:FAD/NAD(P)-binding protein [Enterococcus sp. DIV0869a]MBO0440827.1 FAD/NAD(P)-binding protein [Enterococcus sp. DIV0869a]
MKIAIVGGGPRGLSVLERIVEWSRGEQVIQITMFDPYGPGGKVWREDQPLSLLMNSVASHVTLFTDETLSTKGPIAKGPNLYEWAQSEAVSFIKKHNFENRVALLEECESLGPNDHCSRVFYGLYQKWFYEYIQSRMTEQTSVKFFKDTVRAVKMQESKFLVYTKAVEITVDIIVLALGHQENELIGSEKELATYASEHRLFYSSPKNAADAYLEAITENKPVLVRGLGLVFDDYLTLLTSERGGLFEEQNGELVYHPSGREPQIIAGSGRGIPYHARGRNQKGYGQEYQPRFLKEKSLNKFKRKEKFSAEQFFELLKKEVEFAYYSALVAANYPKVNQARFSEEFIRTKGAESVLEKYGINKKDFWNWSTVQHPDQQLEEEESFQDFILEYLNWDLIMAKKGTLSGPFAAALDSLKDLRDEVRFMLDHELFSDEECKKWLWDWFTPLNSFLSIGPPLERIAELKALIKAGILTLIGPEMKIETEAGSYVGYSKKFPMKKYKTHFLIEARLPKTANQYSLNPLVKQLLRDEIASLHELKLASGEVYRTGALLVERASNQLQSKEGEIIPGLFCYGIPTEGVHWLTAATSRPGTDAWNLREADLIAGTIFKN